MRPLSMKLLIAATALAAFAAAPADAQTAKARRAHASSLSHQVMMAPPAQAIYLGNEYVGSDPDANVRLDLQRETGAFDGGGS